MMNTQPMVEQEFYVISLNIGLLDLMYLSWVDLQR